MTILLITQHYNPIQGGAARRAARLAEYFAKRGHKLTVLTGFPSYPTGILDKKYHFKLWTKETEKIDGKPLKVLRTYEYPAPAKGTGKRIINWLSFTVSASVAVLCLPKFDVVVATCPTFLSGIAGLIAKKIWKCDFYFDESDLWPDSAIDMGLIRQPLLIKLAQRLEKSYYRAAKNIFIATPAMQRHLESEGIDREKIKLMLNSADSSVFQPKKLDRIKFGFKKDDFIITYVGNHSRVYDLETVLRAAKILQNYPRIKFIFIGEGETKEDLVLESQNMALSNVDFLPSQDLEEISCYLNLSDITLIPLVNIKVTQESMPSKTAEYLCAGKPILSSIGCDLKQYIETHEVGLIYAAKKPQELVDHILKLYKNPKLRQKMSQNARRLALKTFSNQSLFKALDRIFSR